MFDAMDQITKGWSLVDFCARMTWKRSIGHKRFFILSCHRQTYQNYQATKIGHILRK